MIINPYIFGEKDPILVIGDSIPAGLVGHTASTLPVSGTAFEYDRNTNTILEFGAGAGITGFSFNSKSPWAKFCIDYFAATGRAACIINRAASSSTISPATSVLIGNDWQTTGTNYNAAVTAANDCLTKLGKTKLTAILVIVGINDVQGQSGTGSNTVAQVGTYLGTLVTNLISDFGSDVPIIFGQIGQTSSIQVDGRLSGIRNQIKQRCFSTSNCYMAANLGAFAVGGFYEADAIHPNVTGNDYLGAMFARWFKNSAYSKWPRALISMHFDELSTTDKNKFETWLIGATNLTIFQNGCDAYYKGVSTLSINCAWDLMLICAPSANGGYTFSANSYIASDGTSTGVFKLGYDPIKTTVNGANNDYVFSVKLDSVQSASTVVGALTGALTPSTTKFSVIRQLNPNIQWTVLSATSFTYTGQTALGAGTWTVVRNTSGQVSFLKNSSVVQGPTSDTLATPPTGEWVLGYFLNNGVATSPIAARYKRFIVWKNSAISNIAQWETDLDTLES
jgi:hypothetical protein